MKYPVCEMWDGETGGPSWIQPRWPVETVGSAELEFPVGTVIAVMPSGQTKCVPHTMGRHTASLHSRFLVEYSNGERRWVVQVMTSHVVETFRHAQERLNEKEYKVLKEQKYYKHTYWADSEAGERFRVRCVTPEDKLFITE